MKLLNALDHHRWFIWTLVIVIVVGIGLATYIEYVNQVDTLESTGMLINGGAKQVSSSVHEGWQRVDLPEWDIVSLAYPPDWTFTVKSKNMVELSKSTEQIIIFYEGDESLTNPLPGKRGSEKEVMDRYISSLKNITSETTNTADRELGTQKIERMANGKKEVHNVFFIGTLLIDVYTNSQDSRIYSNVIRSFQYGGF